MDLLFDASAIYALMLVFSRAGGLLGLMPGFSGQAVPIVVRITLALALSYALGPGVAAKTPLPSNFVGMAFGVGHEVIVGLLMGLAVRLVIYTMEFSGQIMATQVGLMMSSSLDGSSNGQTSPITLALSYLGVVLFFLSGTHHLALLAFMRSFDLVPAAAGGVEGSPCEQAV